MISRGKARKFGKWLRIGMRISKSDNSRRKYANELHAQLSTVVFVVVAAAAAVAVAAAAGGGVVVETEVVSVLAAAVVRSTQAALMCTLIVGCKESSSSSTKSNTSVARVIIHVSCDPALTRLWLMAEACYQWLPGAQEL